MPNLDLPQATWAVQRQCAPVLAVRRWVPPATKRRKQRSWALAPWSHSRKPTNDVYRARWSACSLATRFLARLPRCVSMRPPSRALPCGHRCSRVCTCVRWRFYQALDALFVLQPARALLAHTLQMQSTRWRNRGSTRPLTKSFGRTFSSPRLPGGDAGLDSSFGLSGASSLALGAGAAVADGVCLVSYRLYLE